MPFHGVICTKDEPPSIPSVYFVFRISLNNTHTNGGGTPPERPECSEYLNLLRKRNVCSEEGSFRVLKPSRSHNPIWPVPGTWPASQGWPGLRNLRYIYISTHWNRGAGSLHHSDMWGQVWKVSFSRRQGLGRRADMFCEVCLSYSDRIHINDVDGCRIHMLWKW